MIALDTNALVRLLIEDDAEQAKIVQFVVSEEEKKGRKILILNEVLIETVWVLESVYQCERKEIAEFLERLVTISAYHFPDVSLIRKAISRYKEKGDFADLIIVGQAEKYQAEILFSFDKKFQKMFPDFVTDTILGY